MSGTKRSHKIVEGKFENLDTKQPAKKADRLAPRNGDGHANPYETASRSIHAPSISPNRSPRKQSQNEKLGTPIAVDSHADIAPAETRGFFVRVRISKRQKAPGFRPELHLLLRHYHDSPF